MRRLLQLFVGLFLYGLGIACMVFAALGTAPWDVLTLGLITQLPLGFGTVTVAISIVVLICWIPLRERPGLGTVLNALLIGPWADMSLWLLPAPETMWGRILYLITGIGLIGFASGLYIGARLGPGPRDGLMTGLHRVTGLPIWLVRTALEVVVVAAGWALGGPVGLGTVIFAVTIGPLCQVFLRWFTIPLARDGEGPDAGPSDGAASD